MLEAWETKNLTNSYFAKCLHLSLFSAVWRFDEDAGQNMEGFPKPIAHEWPGVDSHVDAAVAHDGWYPQKQSHTSSLVKFIHRCN